MWAPTLLLLGTVVGQPPADVVEAMRLYNEASERPLPQLRERELRELRAGEVVRRYTPPAGPGLAAGVLGMMVADVSRDELWITIRDGHLAVTEGLTERHISGSYDQPHQVWFGMFELPAPFRARHWRIHTKTELELARRTEGRVWESTWARLEDGGALNRRDATRGKLAGVKPRALKHAIYTVENHGSWLVIELGPRRCLLVYRATADLGGVIPHELVSAFARMRLETLLRGTVDQVNVARPHYIGDHAPIIGGDGRELPRYPLEKRAKR
jgi:hypothetical protein